MRSSKVRSSDLPVSGSRQIARTDTHSPLGWDFSLNPISFLLQGANEGRTFLQGRKCKATAKFET